jgi:hypothetical protein
MRLVLEGSPDLPAWTPVSTNLPSDEIDLEGTGSGADGFYRTVVVPPASMNMAQSPITLNASASSGLPVTYRVVSGPRTVSGNLLSLIGTGAVVVRAEQSGNEQFRAASMHRSIMVLPPTPPALRAMTVAPDGRLRFELEGTHGARIALQFSEDLIRWGTVSIHTVPGSVEFVIPANVTTGFFRAVNEP